MTRMGAPMAEDVPRRVVLFAGTGRARVHLGDEVLDDVPVLALPEGAEEPSGGTEPVVLLRPGATTAIVRSGAWRHEDALLFATHKTPLDAELAERRVRVRELRERAAKAPPLWSRLLRRKAA